MEAYMRDKRERFIELAETRTEKAIRAIRLLGNLANSSNYDYDKDELAQIVAALDAEVKALKATYANAGRSSNRSFRLKPRRQNLNA